MSTSRSSASESESFAENDVSFEESVEDSSNNNSSSHHYHQHQESPVQQQQQQSTSSRQKHYFVDNPNVRYVVNGSGASTTGNNISIIPNYQQKVNSLLPASQYGSQYFMDNNVIHRTYSYYNQPQNGQKFPGQKNPDIVSVRYIAQPAVASPPNGTLVQKDGEPFMYRNAPYVQYPPGAYQYGPSNYKERRIVFGRDSYGTEQNFYYPGQFYNNQAYEMGSQRVLNYDINPMQQPNYDPKRVKAHQEHIKQIENHEPVSSQWNMSGGFGNSYGVNQKFYKELIENSNQPNFNQFYPDANPNNPNAPKDKNNYLGFVSNGSSNRKLKLFVLGAVFALILLSLIVVIVLGTVLPKQFYSQARVANVAITNITLNGTDLIKAVAYDTSLVRQVSLNITNQTSIKNNTLSFDVVTATTLVTLIETTTIKNETSKIAEFKTEESTISTSTASTTTESTTTESTTQTTTESSTTESSTTESSTTESSTTESTTTESTTQTTTEEAIKQPIHLATITENHIELDSLSTTLALLTSTTTIVSSTTPISVNERLIFVDTTTTKLAPVTEESTTTESISETTTETTTESTTTEAVVVDSLLKIEEIKPNFIVLNTTAADGLLMNSTDFQVNF